MFWLAAEPVRDCCPWSRAKGRSTWSGYFWAMSAMKSQKAAEESHNIFFPDTINHSLTKFVRSRWLDITLVLFLCFQDRDQKRKNSVNIEPYWPHRWLTSLFGSYCAKRLIATCYATHLCLFFIGYSTRFQFS